VIGVYPLQPVVRQQTEAKMVQMQGMASARWIDKYHGTAVKRAMVVVAMAWNHRWSQYLNLPAMVSQESKVSQVFQKDFHY
jgi:hypothetical protein